MAFFHAFIVRNVEVIRVSPHWPWLCDNYLAAIATAKAIVVIV